jgi:hypothetical protein
MNLTEQQRELYAAIGAWKEVRYVVKGDIVSEPYRGTMDDPPLGDDDFDWEITDPDTITVSYKIPRPMTVAPEVGTDYWTPNPYEKIGYVKHSWQSNAAEHLNLSRGQCFASESDIIEYCDKTYNAHTARTAAYRKALGV